MIARAAALALALGLAPAALAHEGHLTNVAWEACEGAALGAECVFEDGAQQLYRGSCRSMSGALMCVRNKPLERRGGPDPRALFLLPLVGAAGLTLRRRAKAPVRGA
jgi:hypothetical protein